MVTGLMDGSLSPCNTVARTSSIQIGNNNCQLQHMLMISIIFFSRDNLYKSKFRLPIVLDSPIAEVILIVSMVTKNYKRFSGVSDIIQKK